MRLKGHCVAFLWAECLWDSITRLCLADWAASWAVWGWGAAWLSRSGVPPEEAALQAGKEGAGRRCVTAGGSTGTAPQGALRIRSFLKKEYLLCSYHSSCISTSGARVLTRVSVTRNSHVKETFRNLCRFIIIFLLSSVPELAWTKPRSGEGGSAGLTVVAIFSQNNGGWCVGGEQSWL